MLSLYNNMSLLHWIESSAVATMIRQSIWLYPAVEIVHIFGFCLLVGSAVLFDLRLLGFANQFPLKKASSYMTIWAVISGILVIVSGVILFIVNAVSLVSNPAFIIKLVLLALAAANALFFHFFTARTIDQWNESVKTPGTVKLAGMISIVLWIGIIAAGRFIAYM